MLAHIQVHKQRYYYRRRYGKHTIKLALHTDSRERAETLSSLLHFSFEVLSVREPLFEDLRNTLSKLRDKAVSLPAHTLIDRLINETYEADEALMPVIDLQDAQTAFTYQERTIKEAQRVISADTGQQVTIPNPPVRIEPVLQEQEKAGVKIEGLMQDYCKSRADNKQWKYPEKNEKDLRRIWKLTGIKDTSQINKSNIAKFKTALNTKHNGTSVKQYYQIAQAFIEWVVVNTDALDTNLFKTVNDLKTGQVINKKEPITPELWTTLQTGCNFTDDELRLCHFMYWTGCNIREALSITPEAWEIVEGINCVRILEGKNQSRQTVMPLRAELLPYEGKHIYDTKKTVEAMTAALNRTLKSFGVTTHGFRAGFADRIRELGDVPQDLAQRLMRHTATTVIDKHYGKGYSLVQLKAVIDRLR